MKITITLYLIFKATRFLFSIYFIIVLIYFKFWVSDLTFFICVEMFWKISGFKVIPIHKLKLNKIVFMITSVIICIQLQSYCSRYLNA